VPPIPVLTKQPQAFMGMAWLGKVSRNGIAQIPVEDSHEGSLSDGAHTLVSGLPTVDPMKHHPWEG
jgi:hypothetical protein